MPNSNLARQIDQIAAEAHLENYAVSVFDSDSQGQFSLHGDRLFHAASTFKVAILLAFLRELEAGRLCADDHLQVRNRFTGITDGKPYRIADDRDGDSSVHKHIGRSLPLKLLARVMITRSSNLATNLLIDFLTIERIRETLLKTAVPGVEVRRGVEDLAAHEAGINNEASADGLCRLFRCFLKEGALSRESRILGLEILEGQEFNRMIPAGLPKGTRVAHKTGEISTHCHDAGLVYPPDRKPYVVAILTETSRETDHRQRVVADMSKAVYDWIIREELS